MNLKEKLKGIFSVSAASLALLHSTSEAKTKDIQALTGDLSQKLQSQEVSTTEKLVLAPGANQDEIAKRYAAHRSHSSHSSHASHRSHYSSYGGGGGGYTPSYPSPSAPSYVTPSTVAPAYPKATVDKAELTRRVLEWQKQKAAEGSFVAQYDLGVRYSTGDGVERDLTKARYWLDLSAKQQYAPAIEKLKQLGIPENVVVTAPTQAVVAATNTIPTNPPVLLEKPHPGKKDLRALLKEAAEGSAASQYELGLRYLKGDGVEKNEHKAKIFLEMAAMQNSGPAKSKLEEIKTAEKKN
jgi:TPR repeat protein